LLVDPGDFVDIVGTAASMEITATGKILVAQYMQGQGAGGFTGDPALALAVPVEQYRREYRFHAPVNYEVSYVNAVVPIGGTLLLDGAPVPLEGLAPIGDSGYAVIRMTLDDTNGGNHTLAGDAAFGASVYGYGQHTSYWCAAGLDLRPIVVR
jgi:hypothetical protein